LFLALNQHVPQQSLPPFGMSFLPSYLEINNLATAHELPAEVG